MTDKDSSDHAFTNALRLPWLMLILMASGLVINTVLVYGFGSHLLVQSPLTPDQQITLRTVLYWVAILTLPLTNLIRHIQLRLNQTMPTPTPAKNRYALTVLVSMVLCESIGLYGLLLFCVGDSFNSFIIFTGLSALGMFLYRPKQAEYESIVAALASKGL